MIIEEIFVFILEETPGNEGIPAFELAGAVMPLIGSDPTRVEALRMVARQIAKRTGRQLSLCRFSVREELEVIEP